MNKYDELYWNFPNEYMPCTSCGAETKLIELKEEDRLPNQELKETGSFIYQWPDKSWYQQCSCGWARDDGSKDEPDQPPTRNNLDFQTVLLVRELLITIKELEIENTLLKHINKHHQEQKTI